MALAPISSNKVTVIGVAGLGDDPDRDRVADGGLGGEPAGIRGRLRGWPRGGERVVHDALDGRVLVADADDQLPGVVGGADVHAAVGQALQVRVFLGDRVGVPGDPGRQVAAGRAGEQEFLAEQCRGDRLQVEVAQADQVRDPVPFGLPRRPGGGIVAALAGSPDGLVAAQPPVPARGTGQVDPGQQVPGPAERPPGDSGGDPAADGRGDQSGLGREQPLVRGGAPVAVPRQPARHRGGHGGVGDDVAGHVRGVQDPGRGPGDQDGGQRQPLGWGVQVPGAQPGPRRLSDQGRLVLVLRVPGNRAGPGVLGS